MSTVMKMDESCCQNSENYDATNVAKAGVYELVKEQDCWVRKRVNVSPDSLRPVACTLEKVCKKLDPENWKWKIRSGVEFCYSVEKVTDIFSTDSTALLFSPITERAQRVTNSNGVMRRLIFVDENVYSLYAAKMKKYFESHCVSVTIIPFETTEETKSVDNLLFVLTEIEKFSPDRRNEPIIGIGGGVCLDIVGLAATLYRRRTPYIRVPTTLLGLVDASVGAKTGVNFQNGKNKLGAYVPPVAVFLDSTFLKTLPKRQLINGSGEILKMALVKSPQLFELLETYGENLLHSKYQTVESDSVIQIAIETMLEELVPNLWEDDLNRLVDFGHVISPILEMDALPSLLHGEAVNIDMAYMCVLSKVMGYLTEKDMYRIIGCMKTLGLPIYHSQCSHEMIQKSMQGRLKHGNGKLRLPIPISVGKAKIVNSVSEKDIENAVLQWQVVHAKTWDGIRKGSVQVIINRSLLCSNNRNIDMNIGTRRDNRKVGA